MPEAPYIRIETPKGRLLVECRSPIIPKAGDHVRVPGLACGEVVRVEYAFTEPGFNEASLEYVIVTIKPVPFRA